MTNQEAMRMALAFIRWTCFGECRTPDFDGPMPTAAEAAEALEVALAQQAKPAAYLTNTEQGDMVWTPEMHGEACTYCDEGEFPIPLYTAAPVALQPMTDAEIIAIAERTKTAEPGRDGYVLPISFARAILAAARLKSMSFGERYPRNPDAKCQCEHWQHCKDCHPIAP